MRRILNRHSAFAIPEEAHFLPRLYRLHEKFAGLDDPANREKLVRLVLRCQERVWRLGIPAEWIPGLEAHAREIAELAQPSYPGVVRAMYEWNARAQGKRRWGEKTPGFVNSLPLLHDMFPDAQFVHVVRDGRDVACSIMPLGFGPNTVFVAARRWKHGVQHALRFSEVHPQSIHTLRYEDLVENPEKYARSLCEFLGEEFEPAMIETPHDGATYESHHRLVGEAIQQTRTARWKKELTPRQMRVYEGVAGGVLARFGYEITNPHAHLTKLDRMIGRTGHRLLRFRLFTKPHGYVYAWKSDHAWHRLKREIAKRGCDAM